MSDLFRIDVIYSSQHWIMPKIILGVLLILGAVILVAEGRARIKAGGRFFERPARFFEENYNKVQFWGTILLLVAYFYLLDKIGFTVCSIIFLILFNTLFGGIKNLKNPKYILGSVVISVVATLIISILFGTVFNISLPAGACTIWIKSLGITIF